MSDSVGNVTLHNAKIRLNGASRQKGEISLTHDVYFFQFYLLETSDLIICTCFFLSFSPNSLCVPHFTRWATHKSLQLQVAHL